VKNKYNSFATMLRNSLVECHLRVLEREFPADIDGILPGLTFAKVVENEQAERLFPMEVGLLRETKVLHRGHE
jgi:hypothetical protein